MYKMNGLGRKVQLWVVLFMTVVMLEGCCRIGCRGGNPCEWPSCSIEMGIVPTPWNICGGSPCCDPCYPFGRASSSRPESAQSNGDLGYDDSTYLSQSGEGVSGNGYY
jgi:hypothetical protein